MCGQSAHAVVVENQFFEWVGWVVHWVGWVPLVDDYEEVRGVVHWVGW